MLEIQHFFFSQMGRGAHKKVRKIHRSQKQRQSWQQELRWSICDAVCALGMGGSVLVLIFLGLKSNNYVGTEDWVPAKYEVETKNTKPSLLEGQEKFICWGRKLIKMFDYISMDSTWSVFFFLIKTFFLMSEYFLLISSLIVITFLFQKARSSMKGEGEQERGRGMLVRKEVVFRFCFILDYLFDLGQGKVLNFLFCKWDNITS